jgi:hypothetical protein
VSSDKRLIPHLQAPFGYSAALENVGTSAAPLLAGFAFALIGLTVDHTDALARPNLALLLLVAAVLALVYSVQAAFIARQFYIPPGDYVDLKTIAVEEGFAEDEIKGWYIAWLETHSTWLQRTRYSYNTGIVILLSGVAVTLVPKQGLSGSSDVRLAAVALIGFGAAVEAVWTLGPVIKDHLRAWKDTGVPAANP